ncbi:citrate transporter, partial [Staphylococcus xylosus]
QKGIANGELEQTQDIDIHKLVRHYEHDQEIKFPVRGRAKEHGSIIWINTLLTILVMVIMLSNIAPPEFAFMIGVALALIINYK